MNAIRIGGGSEGGRVCNMQFNTIVYACGEETKFGSWPNSAKADQDKAYWQNQTELRFITVGDCRNQILYNDFHYGGFEGIVFQADQGKAASGCSLGLGIDGSWNSVVYEALDPAGFDMINSQVVALEDQSNTYTETRFLTTRAGFSGEVTLLGRISGEVPSMVSLWKVENESESGELQYVRRDFLHELSQDYRYYRFTQCCRKYERRGCLH